MNGVTAIVAARGGSQRLPNKALLPFAGATMIGHKVRTLMACGTIDRVVVNSDSNAIVAEAVRYGAMPITGRDYRGDTHEMLYDSCWQVGGDGVIVWAHPTNPLVTAPTYDLAVRQFLANEPAGFDSLLSVYRVQRHAWHAGKPLNYDPWTEPHPLAAQTEPVFFQDGAIFIQRRAQFLANRYFFGSRPFLFETPPQEIGDVDTRPDFDACRDSLARSVAAIR